MKKEASYAPMPAADIHGNAGSLLPGERERRYRPYIEPLRLARSTKQKRGEE